MNRRLELDFLSVQNSPTFEPFDGVPLMRHFQEELEAGMMTQRIDGKCPDKENEDRLIVYPDSTQLTSA